MSNDGLSEIEARGLHRFFWGSGERGRLGVGNRGDACRNLRAALSLLLKRELDGDEGFDGQLHDAVLDFQKLSGHEFKDGVCSEGTRTRLIMRLLQQHPRFFDRLIDPERRQEGHCFISYSREDEALVVGYQAAITALGYTAWRDKEAMPAGQPWRPHVREQIGSSYLVFAFATQRFLKSDVCRMEVESAAEQNVPIAILPFALISEGHWLHQHFQDLDRFDEPSTDPLSPITHRKLRTTVKAAHSARPR